MTEFDPARFEDKYVHYFTELQQAYKRAFDTMNEEFDSTLVHAIDQQVLNESEPFYDEETGEFYIELPEDPASRVTEVVVADEKLESVLDRYIGELRTELHGVFELEENSS